MKIAEKHFQLQSHPALRLAIVTFIVLVALLMLSLSAMEQRGQLPFTGIDSGGRLPELLASNETPSLTVFRRSVMNGMPGELTGVWVEGLLAYQVVRGDGVNVPEASNTASIYRWADQRGVTALMIHNTMGGTALYELDAGMQIAAVYGDGRIAWYVSRGITAYEAQAYSTQGFQGPFRSWDCETCGFEYSVDDIQQTHYSGTPHLAFQTCLEAAGRMGFIVVEADPLTSPPAASAYNN